jgi:hypothetical protein
LGFVLLPRRSAEWWLLLAVLLGSCLLVTRWALPLWLGSDLLLIAQFPWRLLAVASLPGAFLPVFCCGCVNRRALLGIALATVAVIVASQHPSAAAFRPLLDQPVSIRSTGRGPIRAADPGLRHQLFQRISAALGWP